MPGRAEHRHCTDVLRAVFELSQEALPTTAHQCSVHSFQREPCLLPALISAVKAELGNGRNTEHSSCDAASAGGELEEEMTVSCPGRASRRQQHSTLGPAAELQREQAPVPVSHCRASTALLPGQADSGLCQGTHLLCGLQTPARRLFRSRCCRCCRCCRCQLGLLSQRPWRGS